MLVRICDKAVDKKKREIITNIRAVKCSQITTKQVIGKTWQLQNVLLYIDPETKKATVQEMWLKDMVGE